MNDVAQVLTTARNLIIRDGWIQGHMHNWGGYCLAGALVEAASEDFTRYRELAEPLEAAIAAFYRDRYYPYNPVCMTAFSTVINFNDSSCTTKADVLHVLGKAIEAVEGKERRAREENQMRGRLRLLRHRLPAAPGQPVHVVVQRQVRERELQESIR